MINVGDYVPWILPCGARVNRTFNNIPGQVMECCMTVCPEKAKDKCKEIDICYNFHVENTRKKAEERR